MRLADLVTYCDDYLRVADVADLPGAYNGLQVANSGTVTRIAAAVDLCAATIHMAVEARTNLLIVHHGLTLGAAAALPVRFPEGVIRPVLDDVTRSHEAVALRLRLDDGKVVQVATAPAVAEQLAGPFLAIAVLAADAEVSRHRGR